MKWPSRYVLKRTTLVTVIAATISISISTGVRLLIGAEADTVTIAVRLVLPFLIAIPLGLIWFSKLERLETSYRKLLKEAAELAKAANMDPLTGLLNRRSFERQFNLAQAHSVPGYFLIADVDYLKTINDQHGHLVGDDAILSAAAALQKVLPEERMIARIGGDEFCAFVPQRNGGKVEVMIANLNQIAEREFRQRSNLINETLTMSIGYLACKGGLTLREAITRADQRLYQRKKSRLDPRNQVAIKSTA